MGTDDRHALIPGWDQAALRAATMIVIGVGAVGTETARLLAQAGVGRLILCDPDVVSESNLSRGALFTRVHVGFPKVTVAASALAELTPEVRVVPRAAELTSGVGLAELRDATAVISCLDSRAARLALAARCNLVSAGMIDGGTHPWGGEVRVFPPGGRCFGCGMTNGERAVRDDPWSCGEFGRAEPAGASAPVSAMIGSWLASTAVRSAFGLSVPDGTLRMEVSDGTAYRLDDSLDPDCPMHERIAADLVSAVGLTADSTAGELCATCEADEIPLSWAGPPTTDGRPRSDLRSVDSVRTLRALGVANRELIPVLRPGNPRGPRYIELASAEAGLKGAP